MKIAVKKYHWLGVAAALGISGPAPVAAFDDSGMTPNEIRFENYTKCAALAYSSSAIDDSVGEHFLELAYDIADAVDYTEDEVATYVEGKASAMVQYEETAGSEAAADYFDKTLRQCNAIGPNGSGAEVIFTY